MSFRGDGVVGFEKILPIPERSLSPSGAGQLYPHLGSDQYDVQLDKIFLFPLSLDSSSVV